MATADDEMLEAIEGLKDAGANVNATKPIKPIREPKKKKVEPVEDPNAGLVTFAEEEGPFVTPPNPEPTLDDLTEALDDCGVGYVPEHDEPNIAGEGPLAPFDYHDEPVEKDVDITKAMLIRKYASATHSIYTVSPNTPSEKTYGTQSVWNYVLGLNHCYVRVKKMTESARGNSQDMQIERDVYCYAELVHRPTGEVLTTTIMCASTDEEWLSAQKNKLSVAYALAQTRAEERLARMMFGYQVALAGLQPTPAEELDVVDKWWGNKQKEL